MLNGAYPAGRFGSVNLPPVFTELNAASNTSIVPALKLVANRKFDPPLLPIASPLYTAPDTELSTTRTALVPPFHPEIVPSSVAKMNRAGLPLGSLKSVALPLKTWPVGAAGGVPPVGGGIVTTSDWIAPAPL